METAGQMERGRLFLLAQLVHLPQEQVLRAGTELFVWVRQGVSCCSLPRESRGRVTYITDRLGFACEHLGVIVEFGARHSELQAARRN